MGIREVGRFRAIHLPLLVVGAMVVLLIFEYRGPSRRTCVEVKQLAPDRSGGAVVAFTPDRVVWWNGQRLSWSPNFQDWPHERFYLHEIIFMEDFERRSELRTAGLEVFRLQSVSFSPDGSRVVMAGDVRPRKWSAVAFDMNSHQAWLLYPDIVLRDIQWWSDTEVVAPRGNQLEIINLETHRTRWAGAPGHSHLMFAGRREGRRWVLGVDEPAQEGEPTVLTEYCDLEYRRTIRVDFGAEEIMPHTASMDPTGRAWLVCASRGRRSNEWVFIIDRESGACCDVMEIPLGENVEVARASARTFGGDQVMLVVGGTPYEGRLFRLRRD